MRLRQTCWLLFGTRSVLTMREPLGIAKNLETRKQRWMLRQHPRKLLEHTTLTQLTRLVEEPSRVAIEVLALILRHKTAPVTDAVPTFRERFRERVG